MSIYGKLADEDVTTGVYMNAYDYMDKATNGYEDLIAMTYFNSTISYEELKTKIMYYANKLIKYGIKKGDCISLVMPNTPEIVYYKYAAFVIGARANLIDPTFNAEGILASINDANSNLVIALFDLYESKLLLTIDRMRVDNVVLVNPSESVSLKENFSIKKLLMKDLYSFKELDLCLTDKNILDNKVIFNKEFQKKASSEDVKRVYEEGLIASTMFTSGTSGLPKAAALSHDAYNIKTKQISYGVPRLYPNDRFLAVIPFFSSYGSYAGMHNSLVKKLNMYMIPKSKPEEFGDLICKNLINTAIGVPKYCEDFKKRFPELKELYKLEDSSFVKNFVVGGDKLAPQIFIECNEFFDNSKKDLTPLEYPINEVNVNKDSKPVTVITGYGGTEFAGPVLTSIDDKEYYDPDSTGVLLPGIKYIFTDPDTGEILENETQGELCLSDPGMMNGYFNNKTATDDITVYKDDEKYYKTGDIFRVNDKQMFYFLGRSKRAMMRPDGHTVHSAPIENVIIKHDLVEECCVVGLKQARDISGAIPTAFVVLKEGVNPSEELVKELDEISLLHIPERNRALAYTFVDSLSYTKMGKVDYRLYESSNINDLDIYIVDYTFFPDSKPISLKQKR